MMSPSVLACGVATREWCRGANGLDIKKKVPPPEEMVTCPRCDKPLTYQKRIDYREGPAKFVYGCHQGHIAIYDEIEPSDT